MNQVFDNFKLLLGTKVADLASDSFKIILMQPGFVVDQTKTKYSDVSGYELAPGSGYSTGGEVLSLSGVPAINLTLNLYEADWDPVIWTALGGPIGPSPGAIIYDDTLADKNLVGFLDFGADYTQVDGGSMTLSSIALRIK